MITLEKIVSYGNLVLAKDRVIKNKGAAGIDGVTCEDLEEWFRKNAHELTSAVLDGTYKPLPIRRVYILLFRKLLTHPILILEKVYTF